MEIQNRSNNYLLLSVVKNEEKYLYNTIKSVVQQSIRPIVWAIFDDGSTDSTPQIIKTFQRHNKWILYIRLDTSHERDLGFHLAKLIKDGFEYLIYYCEEHHIEYEYLANLDGDLILEDTFFEKLINELKSTSIIGIVSGETEYLINNKLVPDNVKSDEPSGGHMLIRKKCFEDCDGIKVSYSWDSIIKVKARLANWNTKRVKEAKVIEVRDVSSADGYWNGYVFHGKSAYFRDLHPLHVLGKSITLIFKKPFYISIAYLIGYCINHLRHEEKLDDEELKRYYRKKIENNIFFWRNK